MRNFAIAVSRFNEEITTAMLAKALDCFDSHGLDVTVRWVPGAFELPLAAKWLAETGRFEAVVCIGAVIRGDTDHYEYVCQASSTGILQTGILTDTPIIFSLLTTDNEKQAEERVDKGYEGALAAIEMANLKLSLYDEAEEAEVARV